MSLGYELAELINDASKLAGGTISNDRLSLTASEIPNITTAKISDIGNYALQTAVDLKADTSYVDNAVNGLVNQTYVDNKVSTEISSLLDNAPDALNTLNELAEALNDNPSFATTITAEIGAKADTTYVDGQLAQKVGQSYVDNAVLPKADTTYVDTQLATKLESSDLASYVTTTTLNTNVNSLQTNIDGKVDQNYVATQLASYATRNYVDAEIAGVIAGQGNLSKTRVFIATAGQTMFGPLDHTSGNVDVWLNGVRLLNQITDSEDTDGSENLTDNNIYDYQSAIGTFVGDVVQSNSVTVSTIAGESSNIIKLTQAPSADSKLVIRSY